mmetsp:Transcript_16620/g.26350  ORF Transcript_16620/g.26350 Transcript_16620/m.26350 type:complete len:204 (+) Transcript_16620:1318-1929(+)
MLVASLPSDHVPAPPSPKHRLESLLSTRLLISAPISLPLWPTSLPLSTICTLTGGNLPNSPDFSFDTSHPSTNVRAANNPAGPDPITVIVTCLRLGCAVCPVPSVRVRGDALEGWGLCWMAKERDSGIWIALVWMSLLNRSLNNSAATLVLRLDSPARSKLVVLTSMIYTNAGSLSCSFLPLPPRRLASNDLRTILMHSSGIG